MASYFDVVDERTGNIIGTYDYGHAKEVANRYNSGSPHPIKSEKDAKMASKEPDYLATCKITWEE